MIGIIDYGMSNLRSVQKSFEHEGVSATICTQPGQMQQLTGLVLPGVGAFGDAMYNLKRTGFLQALKRWVREGRPLLGICLGMQLLASISEENGPHVGLNFIPGEVRRFRGKFKIPHVGWNNLVDIQPHPLLRGIRTGDYFYFVHSYYVVPSDPAAVLASCDYNGLFAAVIGQGSVFGTQFHPEKSGASGLRILRNFASICGEEEEARGERTLLGRTGD